MKTAYLSYMPSAVCFTGMLIIGDSFSDMIQPVLANYFADVTAVGVWSYHMYDLDSYAPDIVIWENAERYTDRFDWINITKG